MQLPQVSGPLIPRDLTILSSGVGRHCENPGVKVECQAPPVASLLETRDNRARVSAQEQDGWHTAILCCNLMDSLLWGHREVLGSTVETGVQTRA